MLLLVNFLVAYLLLQAAGVLTGQRAAFARMLTGSVCAAVSALILFAPELSYPVQIMYKLATAATAGGSLLVCCAEYFAGGVGGFDYFPNGHHTAADG